MSSNSESLKCSDFCGVLPCMYGDDHGCSTSDPSGDFCRKKNAHAKQICRGSHLEFLYNMLSKKNVYDQSTNP